MNQSLKKIFFNLKRSSALQFDGTNYANLGTMGNFGSNLGNGFSCEFDIKTLQTSLWEFGFYNSSANVTSIMLAFHANDFEVLSVGRIAFFLQDQTNKHLKGYTTNTTNFYDGKPHTLKITANPATNIITISVDGVSQAITYWNQDTPNSFANFGASFFVGGRSYPNGTLDHPFVGTIDNFQMGTPTKIYGSFPLSEGIGQKTADVSGNGNVATLVKTTGDYPLWVPGLQKSKSIPPPLPSSIASLTGWFKVDALTGLNDGDLVSTLTDLTGNNTLSSAGAARPTYKTNQINSLPTLRFNGGHYLQKNSITGLTSQSFTFFVVLKPSLLTTKGVLISAGAGNGARKFFIDNGGALGVDRANQASVGDSAVVFTNTAATKVACVTCQNSTGVFKYFANGNLITTVTNAQTFGDSSPQLSVGKDSFANSEGLSGDIAEILIFGAELSDADRVSMEQYLMNKYGLSYPNTSIIDTFTRSDSASSMGTTEGNSLTWVPLSAGALTCGISSNKAYAVSGSGDSCIYIDPGVANIDMQVTLSVLGGIPGLYFRVSDANNFWRIVTNTGNGFVLQKRVGGSYTTVADITATVAAGAILRVTTSGNQIDCALNGSIIASVSDAFNNTATKHGIGFATPNGTTRFDDFSLTYKN